jgi:hypothetical protein
MERARECTMTDDTTNTQTPDLTPHNLGFDPHVLANQMIKDGWFGDSMWEPETAEEYILMAAANPNIANELNPKGLKFWRAAKFRFEADMARKKFNRPPRKTTTRDPA